MKYPNKQMNTLEAYENDERDFMFPHSPNGPVTIRAKSLEEAEEKFNKIITK